MGVRGLTTYINSLEKIVWEDYDLTDKTLIIDGHGLLYQILGHLDCRYGGQYSDLEEMSVKFFDKLISNRVKPYVIFDGILDISDKKLDTNIRRKNDIIKTCQELWSLKGSRSKTVLPLLAKATLLKTLQEKEISYAVADFEADQNIASLANSLECPVLGLDSDFFIFLINHGYIPFDRYDFSGPNMMVRRYRCEKLARYLNIEPVMLPMMASLLGNDYVSNDMLEPLRRLELFGKPIEILIKKVAAYLATMKSSDEAKTAIINELPESIRSEFEKAVVLSLDEYDIKPTHLFGYLKDNYFGSNVLTYNGHVLPEWIVKILRREDFSQCIACLSQRRVFLIVQVENMTNPSANTSTESLRHHLYKLLMEYDNEMSTVAEDRLMVVEEYDRKQLKFVKCKVDLREVSSAVKMGRIPDMAKDTATSAIFNALDCDMSQISHLPLQWQLVTAALRFWITNAVPNITQQHLVVLLVYIVDGKSIKPHQRYPPDVAALEAFAQWQHVIAWANKLNLLFSTVLPALNPVRLYNGLHMCKLYKKIKCRGIEEVEADVVDSELYRQLRDAVLKGITVEWQFGKKRRGKNCKKLPKVVQQAKKPGKVQQSKTTEVLKGNAFASLCLSSDTDEEIED